MAFSKKIKNITYPNTAFNHHSWIYLCWSFKSKQNKYKDHEYINKGSVSHCQRDSSEKNTEPMLVKGAVKSPYNVNKHVQQMKPSLYNGTSNRGFERLLISSEQPSSILSYKQRFIVTKYWKHPIFGRLLAQSGGLFNLLRLAKERIVKTMFGNSWSPVLHLASYLVGASRLSHKFTLQCCHGDGLNCMGTGIKLSNT